MNASDTQTMPGAYSGTFATGIRAGEVTEGVGAIAACVLAIIGLAGHATNLMAQIATIIVGGVILVQGGLATLAYRQVSAQGGSERLANELGGGVSAEFFGGLTGIVLGILAFSVPSALQLLSVSVLVFGASLLIGGMAAARLEWAAQAAAPRSGAIPGLGGHLFVGVGTLVLGILAVIGLAPMTLVLVALLALGAGALFSTAGSAV